MVIIMTKTFSCVYEHDVQLHSFLKEHGLMDVPNLLIQVSSRSGHHYPKITNQLKENFPAATIIESAAEGVSLQSMLPGGRAILSFTLIEEKIFKLAYYDLETGLANRVKFTEQLEQVIALGKAKNRFALLMIDLDRFKNINDSLGYTVGDFILKEMATRLKENISESAFLGRLAGDKFSLLLTEGTEIPSVMKVAKNILERLAAPVRHLNQEIILTASIGICFYPDNGHDGQSLLKNADTAMYCSKKYGGNRITFYETEMKRKTISRFDLEHHLRRAMASSEFYLCYQPLMDLKNGEIIGNEALIRWHHPQIGLVSPIEFIPLAEEVGLIDQIGSWVLKEACQQTKKWQQKELQHLGVAVNVSAAQLQNPGFFQDVNLALQNSGLDSKYLTLELTESTMLDKFQSSIRLMEAIKKLGVKISIDDFGTGYSSLSYIRNLPIHSLKIDRSFVKNIQENPADIAIVRAIILMAEGLGVDIIAEGVETKEQADLLRDLNCDYAQGYFIQKPLVSKEFEAFCWG